MTTILLLSAALAGQWNAAPGPRPPAPAVVPGRPAPAPRYDIRIYKTRYEGMTFFVRGYYRPDIRRIVWNGDDEYNVQSYAIAIVTQATFGDEWEDSPPVVKKPLIASRPVYRRTEPAVAAAGARSRAAASPGNSRR